MSTWLGIALRFSRGRAADADRRAAGGFFDMPQEARGAGRHPSGAPPPARAPKIGQPEGELERERHRATCPCVLWPLPLLCSHERRKCRVAVCESSFAAVHIRMPQPSAAQCSKSNFPTLAQQDRKWGVFVRLTECCAAWQE